jgi:hypothetical protein
MQKSTIVFAATSLALALVVIYLWQQLRDERGLTAQPREQPAPAVVRDPPAARSAATTGSEPTVSTPAAVPTPARTVPDARVINARNNYGMSVQLYPDLAQQLGLSPEQEKAVYDILAQQQLDVSAVSVVMGADGQISEQSQRERDEVWRRHDADLAAYLGPVTWQRFQEYQTTLEARRGISSLGLQLGMRGEPLTESQKEPLLNDMLAEQQRRAREEQVRTYPNMDPRARIEAAIQNLKGREESYQRIMNSAGAYLAPAQLQFIQKSMTREIQDKRTELNAQLAKLNGDIG